jgi:hypothetical protein
MCCCHTRILSYVNDDESFDIDKGRSRGSQKEIEDSIMLGEGEDGCVMKTI